MLCLPEDELFVFRGLDRRDADRDRRGARVVDAFRNSSPSADAAAAAEPAAAHSSSLAGASATTMVVVVDLSSASRPCTVRLALRPAEGRAYMTPPSKAARSCATSTPTSASRLTTGAAEAEAGASNPVFRLGLGAMVCDADATWGVTTVRDMWRLRSTTTAMPTVTMATAAAIMPMTAALKLEPLAAVDDGEDCWLLLMPPLVDEP